ncbi:MAG: cupin domain-containing protein [Sedimentisphaerales bacterium]|nr:cupin domain-containing protein [Sedimentisphaerales bacterium]
MGFSSLNKKGLSKCLIDTDLDPEKLHLHISELDPGKSSHERHTHEGIEVIYVISGRATLEIEGNRQTIGPNEAIIMDASKIHCVTNTGREPLRYMVIKTKC